jgi:S-adenosylmethionine uptake transporter
MSITQRHYFSGIFFFIASLFISSCNDVITKHMGLKLPVAEVVFFRFFFSTILLLPFMVFRGIKAFKTRVPIIHFLRSVILFLAMSLWTLGLTKANIVLATIISFTIPLFVVILAVLFLHEKVSLSKWAATLLGFVGIILILNLKNIGQLRFSDFGLLLAAICFASLDIINKKYVAKESIFSMLFYSSLGIILLASPQTISYWVRPTFGQILYLIGLGAGANLLLYFILLAFKRVDASTLAPFRYIEVIISSLLAYLFFHEVPSWATLRGALLIIPSSLFIIYMDNKKRKKSTT